MIRLGTKATKRLSWYCSFALDTVALLGGQEHLTQQVLEEINNLEYNQYEKEALHWALTEVRYRWDVSFCIIGAYKMDLIQ